MKKLLLVIILLFTMSAVHSVQLKKWVGKLDNKGRLEINFQVPIKKVFFLQAFFLYKKNWRPIKIFFNEKKIWTDLGKTYKNYKYRVHIFMPK